MATDAAMPLFDHPAPHVELNPTVADEDRPRLSHFCRLIADRLRRGPATNLDLGDICNRYGARLHELKRAGFLWVRKPIGGGLHEYRLIRDFLPAAAGSSED